MKLSKIRAFIEDEEVWGVFVTGRDESSFKVSRVGNCKAPKTNNRYVWREEGRWKEGLHGVEGGSNHIVVGAVTSLDFAVCGGVVAVGGFEHKVEIILEERTELSFPSECSIFICANRKNLFVLVTEDGDEESDDVKGSSLAGGWENPRVRCSCIDDGKSCSIVADGSLGVKHEVDV